MQEPEILFHRKFKELANAVDTFYRKHTIYCFLMPAWVFIDI